MKTRPSVSRIRTRVKMLGNTSNLCVNLFNLSLILNQCQEKEKAKKELNDLLKIAVSQPKVPVVVDPKSILCKFYKAWQCVTGVIPNLYLCTYMQLLKTANFQQQELHIHINHPLRDLMEIILQMIITYMSLSSLCMLKPPFSPKRSSGE